jgi:hypothetical protein
MSFHGYDHWKTTNPDDEWLGPDPLDRSDQEVEEPQEPNDLGPFFMSKTLFLIWSYEHNAWWAPGRSGYTSDLRKAGRYTEAEAQEICLQANQYSRHQNEIMVSDFTDNQ